MRMPDLTKASGGGLYAGGEQEFRRIHIPGSELTEKPASDHHLVADENAMGDGKSLPPTEHDLTVHESQGDQECPASHD